MGEDVGGGPQRGHGGEGEGKQLGDLAGGVQAGQRGEFPKGGQQTIGRALGDLHLPGAAQQQDGFLLLAAAGLFLAGGQRKLRPGGVGHTQVLHRAPFAQGAAVGQADERPQFHQRLVKVPDTVLRQHLPDGLAEFLFYGGVLDVAGVVQEAGGHPQHVAVYGGHPQVKGDGGDGPGGVFTQTGEPAQCREIGGERPVMLLHQQGGGFFEVPCAAVIAQSLPQLEELLLLHGGKGGDIRQGGGKALEVGDARLHAGLLEHDLRDPGAVGAGVFPPRQDAAVLVVPL